MATQTARASRGRRLILAVGMAVACGCDPQTKSIVRIEPVPRGVSSSTSVAAADLDAIVVIVGDVATAHGLRAADHPPDEIARFTLERGRLYVFVTRFAQQPNVVDVTVLEWPAFRHSATGRAVLDEARRRLREKFGDVAVSRASETTHSRAS